jgi:hypothetical protein
MIFNCYMNETNHELIQGPTLFLDLEVPAIGTILWALPTPYIILVARLNWKLSDHVSDGDYHFKFKSQS